MRIDAISAPMMEPRRRALPETARLSLERILAAVGALRRRLRSRARTLVVIALFFTSAWLAGALAGWLAAAGALMMAMVAAGRGTTDADDEPARSVSAEHGRSPSSKGQQREADSWRLLLDAVPDAVVALDHNFNIMHFNARLEELFPKARIGQPLSQLSRHPELNAAVDAAVTASQRIVVDLYERVPVERRISASISRIGGREIRRGVPFLIVSFRDLTEQDKLAQMRADFIANASHELRTPLASLRGFVETLQGPARDDPEARDRFLAIMSSQANRMTRLIDDLLSLSRAEMRVHLPPRGIVDLNDVASYVAQALDPVAAASKARIVVTKSEEPVRIRGDRDEIVQVIQNLVHNAIKYGREGGNVEIAVSRVLDGSPPQPRALVAVADDGPGIAPEHLPRLTERFYRAGQGGREKSGTGLGLAIVKHIVLRHRGEFRITSTLGKGSTFSVLFDELSPAGA